MSGESPEGGSPSSSDAPGASAASGSTGASGSGQRRLPSGLFQRLRRARRAVTVIRGYSFFGAVLAVAMFALSFLLYQAEIPRWICRLGAMGVLVSAVVGLNVVDRLVRGKVIHASAFAVALAVIAVALLAVGVGAVRYDLDAAWSPLASATYVVVGVRIMLRFRSEPGEGPADRPRG